jgi:hypothetical protein
MSGRLGMRLLGHVSFKLLLRKGLYIESLFSG